MLVPPALAGGWEGPGRECTRTPTLGRVVLVGLGLGCCCVPWALGLWAQPLEPALRTEASIILPLESDFPSPQTTVGGRGCITRRNSGSPLPSCAESCNAQSYVTLSANAKALLSSSYSRSKRGWKQVRRLKTGGTGIRTQVCLPAEAPVLVWPQGPVGGLLPASCTVLRRCCGCG